MKEEEVAKSNLKSKSKLKKIQEEEESPTEKEMKMLNQLNQSIFSSRLGKNPLANK
jgi:hypothetical protein